MKAAEPAYCCQDKGYCRDCDINVAELARVFVANMRSLLFSCLVMDVYDPFDPTQLLIAPDLIDLLDEDRFIDFAIRLDRQDEQISRALQAIDDHWLGLLPPCKQHVRQPILEELDRVKFDPVIPGLSNALSASHKDLTLLIRQMSFHTNTEHLSFVARLVEATLSNLCSRETLSTLHEVCSVVDAPSDSPIGEILLQLGFYAREALERAPEFAARLLAPNELLAWDLEELTRLFRTRYPLLTSADVEAIRQNIAAAYGEQMAGFWPDLADAPAHAPIFDDELAPAEG